MSLVRLTVQDDILEPGFILKLVVYLLQFYSEGNQIYVSETRHHGTFVQIIVQLCRDFWQSYMAS